MNVTEAMLDHVGQVRPEACQLFYDALVELGGRATLAQIAERLGKPAIEMHMEAIGAGLIQGRNHPGLPDAIPSRHLRDEDGDVLWCMQEYCGADDTTAFVEVMKAYGEILRRRGEALYEEADRKMITVEIIHQRGGSEGDRIVDYVDELFVPARAIEFLIEEYGKELLGRAGLRFNTAISDAIDQTADIAERDERVRESRDALIRLGSEAEDMTVLTPERWDEIRRDVRKRRAFSDQPLHIGGHRLPRYLDVPVESRA